nr:MAG TPA: hypothetical protein [Caudoviricetes sp.]
MCRLFYDNCLSNKKKKYSLAKICRSFIEEITTKLLSRSSC